MFTQRNTNRQNLVTFPSPVVIGFSPTDIETERRNKNNWYNGFAWCSPPPQTTSSLILKMRLIVGVLSLLTALAFGQFENGEFSCGV